VAVPHPQFQQHLAAIPLAADVGRVRRLDLFHGLGAVLVHGLIPDLAVMRDRAKTKIRKFGYGLFALGWTGSNRHWSNYEKAYLILAGLSTPLVLSVHSIVSLDFSVSQLPGWHTTIFPPYFVAGAVYSGFGMVLTLLVPLRRMLQAGGHHHRAARGVDVQSHLATGSIVGYAYAMEFFIAWYSGNPYERFLFFQTRGRPVHHRPLLHIRPAPIGGLLDDGDCNVVVPQFFWFKKIRTSMLTVFVLSILVNVGMWFERFVIVDHLAAPRIHSVQLELLQPDLGGYLPISGDVRIVLHVLPAVHPLHSVDRHRGSQGRHAASRPASSAGRRQNWRATLMPAPYAIMAEFETPAAILHAAEKVRDKRLPQMGRVHAVPHSRHGQARWA
jgi:hypothetical protein